MNYVPHLLLSLQLFELVPTLINLLVDYGGDVNAVANGHSPLALAILNGHDTVILGGS